MNIVIDATTEAQLQNDNLDEQDIPTHTEPSISALYPTLEDEKQMTTEETKIQGKYIYFILSISLVYRKILIIHSSI